MRRLSIFERKVNGMALFIAWLGWLLLLAGIGFMLWTWRQPKPVRPAAIAVSQAAGILALAVFSALSQSPLPTVLWLLLLAGGVLAGVAAGKTVKVEGGPGGIMMRYTAPYLAVWGVLLALSQLSALALKSVPAVLLGLTVVSQGVNTGIQGRILWNYRRQRSGPGMAISLLLAGMLLASAATAPAIAAPANPAIPNAVVNSGYPLTDAEVAKLWYRPFRRISSNRDDVRQTDGCIAMSVNVQVEYNETYTVNARYTNNNRDNVRQYMAVINVLATDAALKNHPNTKYPPTEEGFLKGHVNFEFFQHGNFAQQGYPQLFYGRSKNPELGSLVVWGLYKGYFIQVNLNDRNEWLPAPGIVLNMVLAYGNKLPPAKGGGGGRSGGLTDDEAAAAVLWSSLLLALGQGLIYLLQGGGFPWRKPGVTVTMPPGQDPGIRPQPPQPTAPPATHPPTGDRPPGIPGQQLDGKVFTAGYGWVDPDKTSLELVRLQKARLQALDAGRQGDVDLIDAKLALQQGRLNAATRSLVDAAEQKALIRESMAHRQKSYDTYMKHDRFFGGLADTATVTGYAADFGIDVLAGITGPAGKTVKMWYTIGKGLGKGVGMAIRDGGQLATNLGSGAAEGLFDLGVGTVTDKATGFMGKTFHNKLPLLRDYDAGIVIDRHESAGFVKDAFLGQTTIKSAYTHGIQQGVGTSVKGAGQGMAQGLGLSYGTDWVKKLIGFRE